MQRWLYAAVLYAALLGLVGPVHVSGADGVARKHGGKHLDETHRPANDKIEKIFEDATENST